MNKVKTTVLKTTLANKRVAICSRNDGLRPVIFKLEATAEKSNYNVSLNFILA